MGYILCVQKKSNYISKLGMFTFIGMAKEK